jgi:septum formation protein
MPFWQRPDPLVLASGSAVRRKLLEAAGLPLEIRPADVDERALEQAAQPLAPDKLASLLARAKAETVAAALPGRLILAADQTLACEGVVYSKPPDRAAARAQLLALRGHTHALHSAVAVHVDGKIGFEHVDTARLTMRDFSLPFLEHYLDVAGAAAQASVGGYQLEGIGIHLFERIEGAYFTILGLPLAPLLGWFRREGMLQE